MNEIITLGEINPEIPFITVLYADKTKAKIDAIVGALGATREIQFGRKGFDVLNLRGGGQVVLIKGKGPESTDLFASVSDFVITGTDIGKKLQTLRMQSMSTFSNLQLIGTIDGKDVWGYDTWLGVIIPKKLVENRDFDLEKNFFKTVVTKYGPIITRNVLQELGLKPEVIEVDSNSELTPQVLELLGKAQVGVVEIVQSGLSVLETLNYVVRPDEKGNMGIYEVQRLEARPPTYILKKSLSEDSMIGQFAQKIYSGIDLGLYENNDTSSACWSPQTALIRQKLLEVFCKKGDEGHNGGNK